ncbi:MAG: type 1 glutamine amidotransferase [Caulobacteraceae bacterium]|nr:type 1 glutamine amidotransferase [Caulobacteraceae bacterium]
MLIGILETGKPPGKLAARHGGYGAMFQALIGPGHDYRLFDVTAGEAPDAPEACAAYVITGSSAGVYDDLPWIAPLEDFLRAARGKAKLGGFCFGHQLMAQAFGGVVEKSDKGWGAGLHTYEVWTPAAWMADARPVAVAVSHQDQVVALPPDAQVLGGSTFSPHGILAYGEDEAVSFQCHPEFDRTFARSLLEAGWARAALGETQRAEAIATLAAPDDRARIGDWIRAFLAESR